MIKNKKQYLITRKRLQKFKDALDLISEQEESDVHPLLFKAQKDSIKSQMELLEDEIREFENLRDGNVSKMFIGLSNLSAGIIRTRIVRGFTHAELASKLGISEQQIQKLEADNFQNTSLKRVNEIIRVLQVDVEAKFNLMKEEKKEFQFLGSEGIHMEEVESKIRNRGTTLEICH